MTTSNSMNNQTGKPLEHYQSIYKNLDPQEIAQRCNLEFNCNTSTFNLRILGTEYRVPHPQFALLDTDGKEPADMYEKILFLRYLCEGKWLPSQGKKLSYNEIPWGQVYYRNFAGRCLQRCAVTFGREIAAFVQMMEQTPQLRAEAQKAGDASYCLEFTNNLFVTIILWQGDDEFPPSAQILFDDSFVFAFTAEDLAVVGDILISRLKSMLR